MLPGATVPCSLAGLLAVFRPCFTAPTFPTFVGLLVGLIAQTRRRTVCGMLTGAGLERVWHHSRHTDYSPTPAGRRPDPTSGTPHDFLLSATGRELLAWEREHRAVGRGAAA